jgi:hypothetical protein
LTKLKKEADALNTDKRKQTGQKLGQIFNSRCGDACLYNAIKLMTRTA